ncbi:M20/M25/M40 family metallo-hydrolase [Chryseobacterium lacus]|uniref:Carboxypeptidase Q n=1 Tax=Chryseobacterium lacus TaxID=2058346 RepID=A0A368N1M7_9FLAO|nr:M20/M25/M40 family metallo-hydrolase [Chryseobacterium lacus]RCU43169.1 M20/M25/M40 family metallo-hydrolase [Chryseobacterium lacus]RST28018.1 M20/M25/M40 family metallo-hydrolase [Chryseobacterium lacus]
MRYFTKIALLTVAVSVTPLCAQQKDPMIDHIMNETYQNSQLEQLAYELIDGIGPRLVGSPKMQQAHDWAVQRFQNWGIAASNEQWGEWKSWERGTSSIEMVAPYIKSLEGTQLAFSPKTPAKGITAEVIALPLFQSKAEFEAWLPKVKGKFVMVSQYQPSGRPEYNWKEFATAESFERYKAATTEATSAWNRSMENIGHTWRSLNKPFEEAGAAGIIWSNWSRGFGVNKIFSAGTKKIPVVDVSLEDYGQLYRMLQHGTVPKLRINAQSKDHGTVATFNTVAEIKGTEKPEEYIILSAHLDSWDGGTGATDNATGVITMMEVARILKKYYPSPKRTIVVGLWGSEEQGLNGSRAYVSAHRNKMPHIQAVFNQDNGTGRVQNISGQGFLHAYDYLGRWLNAVPREITKEIKTTFPGYPGSGGSDHASFVAAGVPAFMLGSLSWSYGNYTWHTNRDTYDKIVFDDVKSNVALIAILTYMASEDPEKASTERIKLPIDPRTQQPAQWPEPKEPTRKGGFE